MHNKVFSVSLCVGFGMSLIWFSSPQTFCHGIENGKKIIIDVARSLLWLEDVFYTHSLLNSSFQFQTSMETIKRLNNKSANY